MKKDKILNVIIYVLLTLGIASAAAVFGFGLGKPEPQIITKEAEPKADSVYRKAKTAEINLNCPLLSSGIDNIFYTADPNDKFEFYELNNNEFKKLEAKNVSYTVPMSGQYIPAEITYIRKDGKIAGFGLYSSDGTDDTVHGYDYIFFKLTNSAEKTFLLASTDKNEFYNPDKIYNEAFTVNLSGGEGKMYFNQKYRTIDENGTSRRDYTLFTEESLKENVFFTGRFYGINDGRYDVMKKSTLETRIFENAADFYIGGNRFLRQDGEKLILLDKNEKVLHTFDGILGKNLSRYGNFLTDKNGKTYNLKTDDEIKFEKAKLLDGFFTSVSPDGAKLVIAGIPSDDKNGNHRIILQDLKTGKQQIITEPCIYKPEYPFIEWIDNDKFTANIKPLDGDGVTTAVIDITALLRL